MDPKQLIVHSKDFEGLTHLEVNTYLLRPSNYKFRYGQVQYLPRPLIEILPVSIEVVRLILTIDDDRIFDKLFDQISSKKQALRSLRKIHLKIPESPSKELFYFFEGDVDDFRGFKKWRETLDAVGIELVIEDYSLFDTLHCIESFDD
jgi:hypothetical protein